MNSYDLDNPLSVDGCERCCAPQWHQCICDSRRPNRQPTADEIDRARRISREVRTIFREAKRQ